MKMQHKHGFTIIEVLICVMLVSILSVICIPKLFGTTAKAKAVEVPLAAGTYIKHQDASLIQTNAIGNWKSIGYTAPGERGTTANFQYSEGELITESTPIDDLETGRIGWQTTNLSNLNDCRAGNWWTIKISKANDSYINYESLVSNTHCLSIAGSFSPGGSSGTGNLTPGGISNIASSNTQTTSGTKNNSGSTTVVQNVNQPNDGSFNGNLGSVDPAANSSKSSSSAQVAANGETASTLANSSSSSGYGHPVGQGETGTASAEASGNTSNIGGSIGAAGGTSGGSAGGTSGTGTTTSSEGTTETSGTNVAGNGILPTNQTEVLDSTAVDSTAKTYDPNDLIAGTLETKPGGWNGDGFRNSSDKDAGMVNLKDGITAGVLYTYNTGETDPGKEGLYKLEANSTYTFTVSDADVSWGQSDWLQTEIRVYTESNFSAKGSSSGPAAVMCGTTQTANAAANWDGKSIWSTTGSNTSTNPKGFTATGTYDKSTGVTTFVINTGNETGYFGANFRMNSSHTKLGEASTTVQNQVKEAIQNATLIKN